MTGLLSTAMYYTSICALEFSRIAPMVNITKNQLYLMTFGYQISDCTSGMLVKDGNGDVIARKLELINMMDMKLHTHRI